MILNITYRDVGYHNIDDATENTVIEVNDNVNIKEVINKFKDFTFLYMSGDNFEDYKTEEELQADYPNLTMKDAEKFSMLRDNGLGADLIASAFLEEYPEYSKEKEQKVVEITFDDYCNFNVCGVDDHIQPSAEDIDLD